MNWEAICPSLTIDVGARLCIFWTSRMDGQVVPDFAGDRSLQVQLGDNTWRPARVEHASPASAILILPDGRRFQITPRRDDEPESRIDPRPFTGSDWIVRSHVVPLEPPPAGELQRRY